MAAVKLSKEIVKTLLDSIDTVLFDCDGNNIQVFLPRFKSNGLFVSIGVLWAGSKLLHRSAETVNKLKADGKQIFYVTNNSTKTRSQYLSKLTNLGFNAEEVKQFCLHDRNAPNSWSTERNCHVRLLGSFILEIHWL